MNAVASKSAQASEAVHQAVTESAHSLRIQPRLPSNQHLLGLRQEWRNTDGHALNYRYAHRLGLQAKLQVGPADDPFEHEADQVAERVMRMPAPDESPVTEIGLSAGLQVRRSSCEPCGEGENRLRLKANGTAPESDSGAGDGLDEAGLTRGGRPLPGALRDFFEPRLGRDLSSVRLHDSPAAGDMNRELHSYAFTYGSHIWLSQGQTVGANLLTAHELAHVVQQTSPRALRRRERIGTGTLRPVKISATQNKLMRLPYFAPYDVSGGDVHEQVLGQIGAGIPALYTEAPVPMADRHGNVGHGFRGKADLYLASVPVGTNFFARGVPEVFHPNLYRDLKRGGRSFRDRFPSIAAPMFQNGAIPSVYRTNLGPSSVKIGDLKPLGMRADAGIRQVRGYLTGCRRARGEVNRLPPDQRDFQQWPEMSTSVLGPGDISVPANLTPPFPARGPYHLILRDPDAPRGFRRPWNPTPPITGNLVVRHDTQGVWEYFYLPDEISGLTTAQLPQYMQSHLYMRIRQSLIDPVNISPFASPGNRRVSRAQRKKRPGPRPTISKDLRKMIRRRIPDRVRDDNFDAAQWRRDHRELRGQFHRRRGRRDFREARRRLKAIEALEYIRRRSGLTRGIQTIPEPAREQASWLRKIEFWTSRSARVIAGMRQVFGTAFVRIARFYVRVRDRIRERMRETRRTLRVGRGVPGAIVRAAFSTAKLVIRFFIGQVANRLWDSLRTGVSRKLRSLIPQEIDEQIQERVADIRRLQADLQARAEQSVEDMVQEAVGPYLGDLRQIEQFAESLQGIATIVNIVRWGARVIACLSPPGWGCLWLIGEAVLDALLSRLVETCWFKKKMAPHIANIGLLRRIPNSIANIIVVRARTVLPESLQDVLADVPEVSAEVRESDIECDENQDPERDRLIPQRAAMFRMHQQIGINRFDALGEVARATGVEEREPISAAEIDRLTSLVESSGITAAQLRAYARSYPAVPAGTPVRFVRGFQAIIGPHLTPTPGSAPCQPPAPGSPPPPSGRGGAALPIVDLRQPVDMGSSVVPYLRRDYPETGAGLRFESGHELEVGTDQPDDALMLELRWRFPSP